MLISIEKSKLVKVLNDINEMLHYYDINEKALLDNADKFNAQKKTGKIYLNDFLISAPQRKEKILDTVYFVTTLMDKKNPLSQDNIGDSIQLTEKEYITISNEYIYLSSLKDVLSKFNEEDVKLIIKK